MTPYPRHRTSSSAARYEGVKGEPKGTMTLFDKIDEVRQEATAKPPPGPPVDELLKRLSRVAENLELARKMVFDSGKYDGQLDDVQTADLEAKWEKMTAWFIEYSDLMEKLFSRGVDSPEWHCQRCGTLITAALVSNESCYRCQDPPESSRAFYELMASRGWVAIECKAVDDRPIFIVRNTGVTTPGSGVRYTLDEMAALVRSKPSTDGLKAVHETKREIGGRITE